MWFGTSRNEFKRRSTPRECHFPDLNAGCNTVREHHAYRETNDGGDQDTPEVPRQKTSEIVHFSGEPRSVHGCILPFVGQSIREFIMKKEEGRFQLGSHLDDCGTERGFAAETLAGKFWGGRARHYHHGTSSSRITAPPSIIGTDIDSGGDCGNGSSID
jgi:hypothetical protein